MKILDLTGLAHLVGRFNGIIANHTALINKKADRTLGPVVLQRGMISIGAKPGVVYRNCGYIRVPLNLSDVDMTTGYLTSSVDVKSVVDMDCVKDVVKVNVSDRENDYADEYLTLQSDGVLSYSVNCNRTESALSIRLVLTDNDENHPKPYIMRCEDGLIRPVALPYAVVEPAPPEAPLIPMGNYCHEIIPKELAGKPSPVRVTDPLSEICRLLGNPKPLEIQRLRRHANKKTKWISRRRDLRKASSYWRTVCGVARVRYRKRKRRQASAWTVFSYSAKRDGLRRLQSVLYQQLG